MEAVEEIAIITGRQKSRVGKRTSMTPTMCARIEISAQLLCILYVILCTSETVLCFSAAHTNHYKIHHSGRMHKTHIPHRRCFDHDIGLSASTTPSSLSEQHWQRQQVQVLGLDLDDTLWPTGAVVAQANIEMVRVLNEQTQGMTSVPDDIQNLMRKVCNAT